MSKPQPCDLAGLSVLVTRPTEQATSLSELIQAARGRPIGFPALEIRGPRDVPTARHELGLAARSDFLIFVSANAVRYAFGMLPDTLPARLRIAAVGQATAHALSKAGLDADLVPAQMDSEGLLALPALAQVAGRRILIVRGDGGREVLADTLRARGAEVHYAEVYRRQLPQRNPSNLIRHWDDMVDVVTVTSNQLLDNLFTLLGEEGGAMLRRTPLVVISQRMAEHALAHGCEQVHVAASAQDEAIIATLCEVNQDVV